MQFVAQCVAAKPVVRVGTDSRRGPMFSWRIKPIEQGLIVVPGSSEIGDRPLTFASDESEKQFHHVAVIFDRSVAWFALKCCSKNEKTIGKRRKAIGALRLW